MPSKTTLGIIVAAALASAGCHQTASTPSPAKSVADHGHEHGDGWWCNEHGVPEDVCARCNVKLVADFKAKGDWCQDHERPDSQCFVCHPERETEFAAQYEAKYGKKPPKPEAL
jgi:hypothetical protein